MIFLTGGGSILANVGVAKILSSSASCGLFNTSITFKAYTPLNSVSNIPFKVFKALIELGVFPATYNLRI